MKHLEYNLKYERFLPFALKLSDWLPRRHKIKLPGDENRRRPFFIIGSGRNGSTLLASMLNQHPQKMVPPEQWVLYEMIIKYKLYNYFPWRDLVNIIVGLIAIEESTIGWNTDFSSALDRLQNLPADKRSFRRIIHEIYTEHGRQNNREFQIWGEKSPINTVYLQYIYPAFDDCKYIFLLRDGRDVVSSMVKNNNRPLTFAIWKWNYSIQQYKWLKKRHPESKIHIIKYEKLVHQPEYTLKKLTDFLGVRYSNKMLDYQDNAEYLGVEEKPHHKKIQNTLSDDSIGKWKHRLTDRQIKKMYPRLKSNLRQFGYIS